VDLVAGSYFLKVKGATSSSSGYYFLKVFTYYNDLLEPNDSSDVATYLALDYVSDELWMAPGDTDWYTFVISGPRNVTIDVDADSLGSTANLKAELFNSSLSSLNVVDDVGGSADPIISRLLPPGTYYVQISSVSGIDNDFYYLSVSN